MKFAIYLTLIFHISFHCYANGSEQYGKVEIKPETDLFSLDEDEFDISVTEPEIKILEKDDEIEILINEALEEDTLPKKIELIKEIEPIVIESNKAKTLISESKEGIKEKNNIANFNKKILSISPKKKMRLVDILEQQEKDKNVALNIKLFEITPQRNNYKTYANNLNPPIINRRKYNKRNKHLDTVRFVEEKYQLLFAAIEQGNLIALAEITNKISVNQKILVGFASPLHYAIDIGDINVIRKLIALGYDLNQEDLKGNSAMHIAVLKNRFDIVTELAKYGANPNHKNKQFKRPINLALDRKNYKMANLLAEIGGKNTVEHQEFQYYTAFN